MPKNDMYSPSRTDYSVYSKKEKIDLDTTNLVVIDDILDSEEVIRGYR